MASQLGVRTSEYDGIGKSAPWNTIFAGTVTLAMFTILAALGFSLSIGLDVIDAGSEATAPNDAGESAALWAFVASIFGCCVCARRDCGRKPPRNSTVPDPSGIAEAVAQTRATEHDVSGRSISVSGGSDVMPASVWYRTDKFCAPRHYAPIELEK